ncbi:YlmC/YmxH family sporulation protein [Marasmitruncus massiliensis]|jgi:YlmC/YmxH family sporulation protein|uniref:YlmC/YmxH family sporulation protein n=1 Tax=Marasmitruncus massiliensis TaxID=1944642 RepID=UPI000C7C81F3|nr:YlmC/YmxH family sporulation protein [Marasmitruncus massiliensis]MBE6905669.1 YlmC/YmxH family sporulation protein [Oscillospiraceae bacterium]
MYCRISDLRSKFVINVRNGVKLGYVSDVELDTVTATASALVIRGRLRLLGLLGREDDIVIRWDDIEVIGEDTILVNHTLPAPGENRKRGQGWLHILTED